LEARNQQLKQVLEERTRQLEEATQELQKLLEEKAHFSPDLTPTSHPRLQEQAEGPVSQAAHAISEVDRQAMRGFKQRLLGHLAGTLEGRTDLSRTPEMVAMLSQRLAAIYDASDLELPDEVRQELFREIVAAGFKLGADIFMVPSRIPRLDKYGRK
jgi:hypothetical protein